MLWVLDLDPIRRCPGPIAALAMLRYRPRTRPPLPRGHMHSLMRTRLIQRDPRIAVIQHPLRCVCGAGVKALQTFRPTVWPDGFDEVACAGFQRLDIEHGTSSRHRKTWEASWRPRIPCGATIRLKLFVAQRAPLNGASHP